MPPSPSQPPRLKISIASLLVAMAVIAVAAAGATAILAAREGESTPWLLFLGLTLVAPLGVAIALFWLSRLFATDPSAPRSKRKRLG